MYWYAFYVFIFCDLGWACIIGFMLRSRGVMGRKRNMRRFLRSMLGRLKGLLIGSMKSLSPLVINLFFPNIDPIPRKPITLNCITLSSNNTKIHNKTLAIAYPLHSSPSSITSFNKKSNSPAQTQPNKSYQANNKKSNSSGAIKYLSI